MVRHPYLARHINDASWGTFFRNLAYKAEEAGCGIVKVSPNKTSITCSQCRTDVPKTLAARWHRCPNCGLHIHRDFNSAEKGVPLSEQSLRAALLRNRKLHAKARSSSRNKYNILHACEVFIACYYHCICHRKFCF